MHSIADSMSGLASGSKKPGITEKAETAHHESEGEHTQLHPHGDGTYHTVISGEKTDHPHIGHALVHMGAHHEPGKHHHVHQGEDGAITSHHAGEDGQVQGPHNHENIEALKENMGKFLDEEESEYGGSRHKSGGSEDSIFS